MSLKFYNFEINNLNIIIFNSPTNETINELNDSIKKYSIEIIFRICEPLYNKNLVNCCVEDIELLDGSFPSNNLIKNILIKIKNKKVIGIHCKAGLGRSPTICAILLLYYTNKNYIEVVELIRSKIKGAINKNQLEGLKKFNKNIDRCIIF